MNENQTVSIDESLIRDRLWNEIWRLRYDALYAELASEYMLTRWMTIDSCARIIVALFASSSAIAGWSLWSAPGGKNIWACLAGIAALISIIGSSLGVQERVKRFAETKTTFLRLRLRLEGYMALIRLNPHFEFLPMEESYRKSLESYEEAFQSYPHDIFFTVRAQARVQDSINRKLENGNRQN